MSEEITVNVDSKDADTITGTTSTPSDFQYSIGQRIIKKSRADLIQAVIPNVFYSVRAGFNSALVVTQGVTTNTVNFEEGTYTHNELATEIATRLNTEFSTSNYSCSFSNTKDIFTIDNTSDTFTLKFDDTASDPNTYKLLGFDNSATTVGLTATGTNSPRIRDTFVYIRIDTFSGRSPIVKGKTKEYGFILPIVGAYRKATIFRNPIGEPIRLFEPGDTTDKIQVNVFDENGNNLDLRGHDTSLTIRFR